MVELSSLDIVNGSFSLLVMIISIVVGIFVGIKYKRNKDNTYLYLGIAFAGIYCSWWPGGLSFLSVIFTGVAFNVTTHIIIAVLFIPIVLLAWLAGFTELMYKEKQKQILLINAIILAIAEVYIIIALIIDPVLLIGNFDGNFSIQYNTVVMVYLLYVNFSGTITAFLFARALFRSNDPNTSRHGVLLILWIITYPICGVLDGGLPLDEIGLIIVRTILIIGVILLYFGMGVSFSNKKGLKKI